jgi:RNA polymerase sigma-70 factor (ECF subfamily)
VSLELSSLSDGELAALTLGGRDAAFAEIMRRHREPVYRLVRAHVGDADEAFDLVQECFAAAYRALGRYDPARPMRAWLSTIALNKSRDWGRKRWVRRLFDSTGILDDEATRVADERAPPDRIATDRQELARATRAITVLPTALKEPLILRTIEGLSQAETAQALGISEKAVETRLRRARERLSRVLADDASGAA